MGVMNVWGLGSPTFVVESPDLQRLEAARKRNQLTVREWAKRAGVSESHTRGIMKGRLRPRICTLAYLAVAVGLTIEDVVEGDATPIPSLKNPKHDLRCRCKRCTAVRRQRWYEKRLQQKGGEAA